MIILESSINTAKEMIERYYKNVRLLEWKREQKIKLEQRLLKVKEDRKGSACLKYTMLNTDIQGVNYDRVVVMGGTLPISPMENEIERMYARLDYEYNETMLKLTILGQEIREKETDNEKIEFYLNQLETEHRKALDLKYLDKKSITEISFILHVSKSTVSKYFSDTYAEMAKLLTYYA